MPAFGYHGEKKVVVIGSELTDFGYKTIFFPISGVK